MKGVWKAEKSGRNKAEFMFTREYNEEIRGYFEDQMELLYERKRQLEQGSASAQGPDSMEKDGLRGISLTLLEKKIEEINRTLENCGEDEGEALRFLYSAMPVSDMVDYPASIFLAYARHAAFLWKEGPFAGRVPEKLFANYVLHHRINNEDMSDDRAFFYEKLKAEIAGRSMEEAVLEANLWCAREATYRITDRRDQSPLTLYRTGIGRCGEESTFAIHVLRSIGIPARQVYVPLWSHCDSNHAWVEAWCDGKWKFFGACEPEEKLDMGWFVGPATRAVQVHSRWYGKDRPEDQVVGRKGMSQVVNHLDSYARKGVLQVKVVTEDGQPVPGARVDFNVLNGGMFGNVAVLTTGSAPGEGYGEVKLFAGLGSLQVCAWADGKYGEAIVRLEDGRKNADTMTAGENAENIAEKDAEDLPVTKLQLVLHEGLPGLNVWREADFFAPREAVRDERTTQLERDAQEARLKEQAEKRQKKSESFYCAWEGERVLGRFCGEDRKTVLEILKGSLGNQSEIVRFLDEDFGALLPELCEEGGGEHWKLEVLRTLREKDYWDIRMEVLTDCCIAAAPYAREYPADIFYPFLLCPRVADEMLRPCRLALLKQLPRALQEEIRKEPERLPGKIAEWMVSMPDQEYGSLVASPLGSLTGGIGNQMSQALLAAVICRTLGIPARLRFLDRSLEYYRDGTWHVLAAIGNLPGKVRDAAGNMSGKAQDAAGNVPGKAQDAAGNAPEQERKGAKLVLCGKGELKLSEWGRYSVSRFEQGRFRFLFLRRPGEAVSDRLEAVLEPGIYRAVTTNRLPTGDQYVRICDFTLAQGEEKQLELELRDFSIRDLCRHRTIADCCMEMEDGKRVRLSSLTDGHRSAFIWLQPGKEPTEHVLNELLEEREQIASMANRIYLIADAPEDYLENDTLKKTVEALPMLGRLVCASRESYRRLSESAEQNPGKLPLEFVLLRGTDCIYSDGGYNVGIVRLLLRVLLDEEADS